MTSQEIKELIQFYFQGNYEDYEVIDEDGEITVIDKTSSRDGKNTLRNVEKLQFLNKTIEL